MNELIFGINCFIGWITKEFGGWNESVEALLIFMSVDYITGILAAIVWKSSKKTSNGYFESHACFKGLLKKGIILAIILIAAELDQITTNQNYIRNTVVLFFIANEGLSLLENLCIMGIPFPEIIKNSFISLKDKVNKSNK